MLNFAVGPVMMDQDILDIGSEQIPYFRTEEFSNIMLENERLLLDFTNAPESSRVLFLTASGTASMEAAVINCFTQEDRLLIVNGGSFGRRFAEICEIHDLKYDEIKLSYGENLKEENLFPFENKDYTGFLINVHETSTGVLYDMKLVKNFCKRNNLFLVVDAISSFLADSYNISEHDIDITILSSQKAISLPPGISFIVANPKAIERIESNHVKSLYFNLRDYLKDGERGQTPYTPAVGILLQLNKKLNIIKQHGLENTIKHVESLANNFRSSIEYLPLEIASTSLSNAITPVKPKGKMTASQIFKHLKDKYDIFVVPNGGELADILFRVGHIGVLTLEDNKKLLNAFNEMFIKGIL